ncbi:hypothetical protein I7I50_09446 [Histoplasma capsulatum G186AR]|uniref:Uncharacterized protein n=1 Tax=Ajellomyces capsulatus TaxID=5037 RepID=A0A8H8D0A8_AJECA|nr:hypothetical protein I7I52_06967 [Histoplasma capsulatum]QSS74327.1 hypothetical protein I7I50_09446 [Histoplasma capsulatum G186AR]
MLRIHLLFHTALMSDSSRYTTSEQGLSLSSHEGRNLYVPEIIEGFYWQAERWRSLHLERPNNDLYCKDFIELSQTNEWAKISIPYLYIIGVIDYS